MGRRQPTTEPGRTSAKTRGRVGGGGVTGPEGGGARGEGMTEPGRTLAGTRVRAGGGGVTGPEGGGE